MEKSTLMDYLEWNDRIAAHFFAPDKSGRPVYLAVTPTLLDKIGLPTNDDACDFVRAVKIGPPWASSRTLCGRALEAIRGWRNKNLIYPPYVGYLALFVAAANLEGDFSPHSYYPRLRAFLGEPKQEGTYPGFEDMEWLWSDLERWTNVAKMGEWGVFVHRIYGGWIHVGLPRSQAILNEDELRALPSIFASAGLDPTSPPSDAELAISLSRYGQNIFRQRVYQLLRGASTIDEDIRNTLIGMLADELRSWSGEVPLEFTDGCDSKSAEPQYLVRHGALRLCCKIDRTAQKIELNFRCKTPDEFPEDGLELKLRSPNSDSTLALSCEEWGNGWSTPVTNSSGQFLNAANFDLLSRLQLDEPAQGRIFRMPAAAVRLLVSGESEGIRGLVEVRRLPGTFGFWVLTHHTREELIDRWGTNSCDEWTRLRLAGLPSGWALFSAARARDDSLVRDELPVLSLPSSVSLLLKGGLRVGRGNRYFHFAPPRVELIGGTENSVLVCNQCELHRTTDSELFDIPTANAKEGEDNMVLLEVKDKADGSCLARTVIYLMKEGWDWAGTPPRWSSIDGIEGNKHDLGPAVCGAALRSTDSLGIPAFDFGGVVSLVAEGTVHYIGREPGQIVHWPEEALPESWTPVWVVISRKRGEAMFCGSDIRQSDPLNRKCGDKRKLKQWKEVLWYKRLDISAPKHPELKKLWTKYRESARDA